MTNTQRFKAALEGKLTGLDRLPLIEWATWWQLTVERWKSEGFSLVPYTDEMYSGLGLDVHRQYWLRHTAPDCPKPSAQGKGIIEDEDDYERIRQYLYPADEPERARRRMLEWKASHDAGETVLWYTIDGGFWCPRTLFGIEGHLYSFYDEPELYRRILDELADYQLSVLEQIYSVCVPEFMTIAEDMSYNKGPMLSEKLFKEFLLPYYKRIVPYIKKHSTRVIVDSDGDISEMVPWLIDAGIEGALPLEYQAGVDVYKIRQSFPKFIMIGGYNKRIMKDGEAAMKREFERLLPIMRSGSYIPSVDHQTPPDVPIDNYRIYVKLLNEYCTKAVIMKG